MVDEDIHSDAAAHMPVCQPVQIVRSDQFIGDAVGHHLVKNAFCTKTPEVEFVVLEFDATLIGSKTKQKMGEVLLPNQQTETGELGQVQVGHMVAFGMRAWKTPPIFGRLTVHREILMF